MSTGRRAAHHDLVGRAARGALTRVERAALQVLLERVLIAAELTEEEGPDAGWWTRVIEAHRALLDGGEAVSEHTEHVGGAEVHRLRRPG